MAAEEPALTRPVDPDDIGKVATFDGADIVWTAPSGGGGDGGTPGLIGDVQQIDIGDAAAAGSTGRYADAAHQHALPAPVAPAALGATATAGSASTVARSDHVHPYPSAANVGADPAGTAAAAVAALSSVYQPLDSDLTALAALTTTSFGRGLLELANAAALRTTAGLVIGTDVQAYSAVLAATTASFTTADETKLDGIEAGATADMSAAEILAALLTVDGAGSGLDADLLDGNSAAAFATAAHNHDATYQPLDSDLTAIAALTTTVFGRALLALADAAALRTAADVGAQAVGGDLTGTVGNAQIAAGAVGATELATDAVTNAKVADDAIGIAELSATGTPSSSTFLRGDNSWATPSGGASALDDLTDVTITGASTGQVLKYNGSAWVNDTDATAGGTTALDDLSDVAITAAASGDILRHNGTAWVDTPGTDHYEAAGAVSTHSSDTTSVHGIADTSALATSTDVSTAVSNHAAATDPHGDRAYADGLASNYEAAGTVATHSADTTSVHGIADTSALLTTSSGIDALSDVTITAAASGDILRHNGTAWVDAVGTTHFEAAGAVAAHEADTTSIHGIADTSALLDTADIGVNVQAYSSVLAATTASFTTADETKLDGIEAGATADMSAAEILAALLTVDGAGSGLDADLLDGNSSAAFATAGHDHTGTYQPLDSELTALAGLTSAADKLPYFTGSGTAALADLSSFARTLIDDTDAVSARATLNAVARINGGVETVSTNSAATGSVTVDLANGNLHALTLTGNVTSLTLSGSTASHLCSLTLLITQDATGGRSITWPASVKWLPAGSAPTFTTTASTVSVVELFTIDNGTTWYAGLAGTGIS